MYKKHEYYVYIMASINKTLYIGMTNDLYRRVYEHKHERLEGFSKEYHCHKLVYAEYYQWVQEAIGRETQLKKWRREKKIALVEKNNPEWNDLSSSVLGKIPPLRSLDSLRSEGQKNL